MADDELLALEARRDLRYTWLHVDMDAFFASVEELENPPLVCCSRADSQIDSHFLITLRVLYMK